MTPLVFSCLVALVSYAAGLLGSLVGVSGGIIIVPLLTLLLGVDIHHVDRRFHQFGHRDLQRGSIRLRFFWR